MTMKDFGGGHWQMISECSPVEKCLKPIFRHIHERVRPSVLVSTFAKNAKKERKGKISPINEWLKEVCPGA